MIVKLGSLSKWLRNARVEAVKDYIKGDVLDLGCGNAELYTKYKSEMKSYIGVDYNMFEHDFGHAKFFDRNLDEDELKINGKFDRIFLLAVVEHIFNQKHLYKEILKYLKPKGKIIITTPTVFGNDIVHRIGANLGLFSKSEHDDHITIFNKERFNVVAKEFGLKMEKYRKFELGCNQLVVFSKEGKK